jgi:hypothetical protein
MTTNISIVRIENTGDVVVVVRLHLSHALCSRECVVDDIIAIVVVAVVVAVIVASAVRRFAVNVPLFLLLSLSLSSLSASFRRRFIEQQKLGVVVDIDRSVAPLIGAMTTTMTTTMLLLLAQSTAWLEHERVQQQQQQASDQPRQNATCVVKRTEIQYDANLE